MVIISQSFTSLIQGMKNHMWDHKHAKNESMELEVLCGSCVASAEVISHRRTTWMMCHLRAYKD